MRLKRAESGQIMPMVALMMVVIIGMAAFAIDGSNVYAQHRRMQADLDVAIKVAAAKMFDFNPSDAAYTSTAQTAIQSAAQILQSDGFPNNIVNAVYGSSPNMTVSPFGTGLCGVDTNAGIKICTPPISSSSPFYGHFDYVEGFLSPDVHGFFGGVLGLGRIHISVRAVAWHGGADEPFTIIGLDPSGCSIQVQDASSTLITHGSIHANGQTCLANNGTGTVTGTSESVIASTNPITGAMGTQNGGVATIGNPYSPTVPMPALNAITICSNGCTATSFTDPSLPAWAKGDDTTYGSCYSNLQAIDPSLAVTPPNRTTYYLPPDAPNAPSLPWGSTAKVIPIGFSTSGGEYDFFPHCNSPDPDQQTGAIYYFTGSPDMTTSGGPTINSFNSAFVFDPAASNYLIHANGNGNDQWVLNAPNNGPLQGIAIYENEPCGTSTTPSMELNGSASSHINGIVDAACAAITVTGNSTNTSPFVDGAIVGWDVTVAGHGTAVVDYNPSGLPPDRGSVLVE